MKENRVSNIVMRLHGDRGLLELVGNLIVRYKKVKSLYCTPKPNVTNICISTILKKNKE